MPNFLFSFLQSGVKNVYDIDDRVLGEGKFAQVKKAKHKKSGRMYAVKIITKDKCKSSDQEKFGREIDIMRKVDHPNCIKFYEMFESRSKLYLIIELVSGGELFDRVISKTHYSEKEAAVCFEQIISGINYLHSIGIVHRDMKPENVLYESPFEDSKIKIADFGLGRILDVDGMEMSALKTVCGTPSYVAPEIIHRKGYGKECDVWSSGIILYILLCGFPPFDQDAHVSILFDHIKRGKFSFPKPYWDQISEEAMDLVKGMMTVDPKKRLTPEQCLKHKWLTKFHEGKISDTQLSSAQDQLKEYAAARKLKGAINTMSALQKMTVGVVPFTPTAEQQATILAQIRADPERLSELRESFNLLDRNRSGVIDTANLQDSVNSLGHQRTEDEINNMVQRFDVHKTGNINFDEFCIIMGPSNYSIEVCVETEEEMRKTFDSFDFLRTGAITHLELKEVLMRLGAVHTDEEIAEMIKLGDINKDGVIDYEEFKTLISTKMPGLTKSSEKAETSV
mmetsp:Transcript_41986/g.102937  ORF Transcript_41986/g.102937 Transcript_41986/m.102937 type:complete len:509 (+) Transcript_41986:169-1695(+)